MNLVISKSDVVLVDNIPVKIELVSLAWQIMMETQERVTTHHFLSWIFV